MIDDTPATCSAFYPLQGIADYQETRYTVQTASTSIQATPRVLSRPQDSCIAPLTSLSMGSNDKERPVFVPLSYLDKSGEAQVDGGHLPAQQACCTRHVDLPRACFLVQHHFLHSVAHGGGQESSP